MINADSEKRRKTLIRVHLSTAPEAKWSLVLGLYGRIYTTGNSVEYAYPIFKYETALKRSYRDLSNGVFKM